MKLKEELELEVMRLGDSIHHFCDTTEEISERELYKIDDEIQEGEGLCLDKLTETQIKCLHTMHLRIIGYAMLKSIMNIHLCEKMSRKLGVSLIQEEIKEGKDVPSDVIDGMLDAMSKDKKK